MSANQTQDHLSRSIRVLNIPADLDRSIIISYLKSAGELTNVVSNDDKLIVTYETASQRSASLNLIGHRFENKNYALQIEKLDDETSPRKQEEDDLEVIRDDFEVVQESPGSESPVVSMQKIDENTLNPTIEEGFEKVGLDDFDQANNDSDQEEVISQGFTASPEKEERIEEEKEQVKKRDGPEVKMILRFEPFVKDGERKVLDNDPFQEVIKPKYLLTFTFGWAVYLFIKSIA